MTPLRFVTGDATRPIGDGMKLLAHVVNDRGGYGKGFAAAVARRFPEAKRDYLRWWSDAEEFPERFELGMVQTVRVAPDLVVVHLLAQHGYTTARSGPAIRYDALAESLRECARTARAMGATVHIPRIGAGLAGGDWTIVQGIVERELSARDVAVTVYDLRSPRRSGQ